MFLNNKCVLAPNCYWAVGPERGWSLVAVCLRWLADNCGGPEDSVREHWGALFPWPSGVSSDALPAGLFRLTHPSLKVLFLQKNLSTQPSLSLAPGYLLLPSSSRGSPLSLVISLCSAQTFVKSPFINLSSSCANLSMPSVSCREAH